MESNRKTLIAIGASMAFGLAGQVHRLEADDEAIKVVPPPQRNQSRNLSRKDRKRDSNAAIVSAKKPKQNGTVNQLQLRTPPMTDLTVEDIERIEKTLEPTKCDGDIELSFVGENDYHEYRCSKCKRANHVWIEPEAVDIEALCALARQALAAREDGGWRPINSVPKDETVLLLEDWATYAGSWDSAGGYFESACGQPVVYTPEPTHWRPLPPPPTEQTEGEET